MYRKFIICKLLQGLLIKILLANVFWPQSSGPNKNWKLNTKHPVPTSFSVRQNKNIAWKIKLPEVGQGGISIWKDKCFVSTLMPIYEVTDKENLKTDTIIAYCIDIPTQKIEWTYELKGSIKSPYAYGFSDSSTPGSVTDGTYVWFYNASGSIACLDFKGNLIWKHDWKPVEQLGDVHYPFNKQFEPILYKNSILNMQPNWKESDARKLGWNYLLALDKKNGKELWWSEAALTQYNTPCFSKTSTGIYAALIGRGGYHKVPEKPLGYSLINLDNGHEIWSYESDEGNALFNSTWNEKIALWYTEQNNVIHKLNSSNGQLLNKISLTANADYRKFNTETGMYQIEANIDLNEKYGYNIFPGWYSNIIVEDHCYFFCFKKKLNKRLKKLGPDYCMARVNLLTGKAEYLEVPVQIEFVEGDKRFIWKQNLETETINSRGLDVAHDPRSKSDGWVWNFNGNPICINGVIYYTLMSGIVYCIDTKAEIFDEKALISVNDLGAKAKTWSLNSPAYSEGKLFHRTMKELICIEIK
jgi:hypothetical protein